MSLPILELALASERDVVVARQRSRQIAGALGFDAQDQTRVATAVSEIARNAVRYARGGKVEFSLAGSTAPQVLFVQVSDRGPGIANLDDVLRGNYRSSTGMGVGIIGSRRLMDGFEIGSSPKGTRVVLKKLLPRGAPLLNESGITRIIDGLRAEPRDVYEEVQRQNQELLHALDELRARQEELLSLNNELQDTNRGVLALYAELDEKADHLRRASELKTRFLSDMSHEFRTPLNSTLALTRLLLERLDGPLTREQELQVTLIRDGAEQLLELVNDMLDLAKAQAGKVVVRPIEFQVRDLFGALRGMLRPLLVGNQIDLVIEAPEDLPALETDEGKVSQVLRNLISNSLKFTERGEVRVSAEHLVGDRMRFVVADTGIGIAPEDQKRIFEEFGQLDNPIQRRVRGTGLGLPLSRQLATLLGGTLTVESALGMGSRFTLEIPRVYAPQPEPAADASLADKGPQLERLRVPILVVEDDVTDRVLYESFLRNTRFQGVFVVSVRQAREMLALSQPVAIVLDVRLEGEETWQFLADIKSSASGHDVPVLVVTTVDDERKAYALGADAFRRKPVDRAVLLEDLARLCGHNPRRATRILVVDDDTAFRYSLRRDLERLGCSVEEAETGDEGVQRARVRPPELVFLDLQMPVESGDGESALDALRQSPRTASLPVVLISGSENETGSRLQQSGAAVFVPKDALSFERLESLLSGGTHARALESTSSETR